MGGDAQSRPGRTWSPLACRPAARWSPAATRRPPAPRRRRPRRGRPALGVRRRARGRGDRRRDGRLVGGHVLAPGARGPGEPGLPQPRHRRHRAASPPPLPGRGRGNQPRPGPPCGGGAVVGRSREEGRRRLESEERMRMARDLDDVVAHNISVINVQANTALHLMDRQPERARAALTTINAVSKQALVELRSVLGVLRDVDAHGGAESAPRAPTPGLARRGDLGANAAAAGLAGRLEANGRRPALPADVDLAAYRIIQEALTNSARHSGCANATVRVRYGDDGLRVEVDDDGRSRPPGRPPTQVTGSGHGIAGMTERAATLGGML